MKHALVAIMLAACAKTIPKETTTVMVVDRTFDRTRQPITTSSEIPATSYRPIPPEERWSVKIEGAEVVLIPLARDADVQRLSGDQTSGTGGERRFELKEGAFAGGRFVLRGDDAELTIYGSGVPVVSSERGKLVQR